MSYPGSPFDAEMKNGRVEGHGRFTFPSGHVYEGAFKDGMFHGMGTIYLTSGGQYEAEWHFGKVVKGKYTFQDGLVYEDENWDYCTKLDRRFYTERVGGLLPAGESKLTNNETLLIPSGARDVGDGYYDSDTRRVYSYDGRLLRIPDEEEITWIERSCRLQEPIPDKLIV